MRRPGSVTFPERGKGIDISDEANEGACVPAGEGVGRRPKGVCGERRPRDDAAEAGVSATQVAAETVLSRGGTARRVEEDMEEARKDGPGMRRVWCWSGEEDRRLFGRESCDKASAGKVR